MEQSILENSKGATYMSFILDIEIVIKKDGARVNVAETKTKSQVSKKKDGESKEPYATSRNQDVKVYAVSDPRRKSIFELPLEKDGESNLSESNKTPSGKMNRFEETKIKSLSKDDSNTNKTTMNKENKSDNINFQAQADAIKIGEKSSIPDGTNSRPKRKKISKAEKKAKVFKGKIEPIDFLECNRIFMCNYFKIPMSRRKRNIVINNRSSDSQVIASEENCSKVIDVKQKSLSIPKLDKPTLKTLRLHKFWKAKSSSLVNKGSTLDKYSLGDCDAVNPSYKDSNEFEISKLSTINSDSKTSISFSRNIQVLDSDKENIGTEYKEHDRKFTVFRHSKSMPKIKENINLHNVTYAKSDINQHKYYKNIKKKSVSFKKGLRNKTNSKSCQANEGLLGLQINCFDDVDYVLAPQLNIKNGGTKISNCSVDNICILKEDHLSGMEKNSHTNFKKLTKQEKSCSKMYSKPKDSSELVLEDGVCSNSMNINILKSNEIEGKCDKLTAVNTVYMKNDVLPDLQSRLYSKPDINVIMPQINISSPELDENYSTENERQLQGDANSEIEERESSNENGFKTILTFSSKHTLNGGLVENCDVDVSQTATENQTPDITEHKGKKGGKSKTTKLKILHSYMKSVTTKFRK